MLAFLIYVATCGQASASNRDMWLSDPYLKLFSRMNPDGTTYWNCRNVAGIWYTPLWIKVELIQKACAGSSDNGFVPSFTVLGSIVTIRTGAHALTSGTLSTDGNTITWWNGITYTRSHYGSPSCRDFRGTWRVNNVLW